MKRMTSENEIVFLGKKTFFHPILQEELIVVSICKERAPLDDLGYEVEAVEEKDAFEMALKIVEDYENEQ